MIIACTDQYGVPYRTGFFPGPPSAVKDICILAGLSDQGDMASWIAVDDDGYPFRPAFPLECTRESMFRRQRCGGKAYSAYSRFLRTHNQIDYIMAMGELTHDRRSDCSTNS